MPAITAADRTLVCVGGLHRSGTTLITECLTDHSQVSGFSHTGVRQDEGQFLQTVYPIGKEFGGPGRFGFHDSAHLTEQSDLVTAENTLQLWREWSGLWDLKCPVLLEKSPPNLIRYRFLQAMFPEARFITVMRHPLAVALATKKWSKTTLNGLIEHWLKCHKIWIDDSHSLVRQYAIKYEEFVTSPQSTLTGLFSFLDLKPIPLKREVINANTGYLKKWNDVQHKWWSRHSARALINRFEDEVATFGYSLRDWAKVDPLPAFGARQLKAHS